MRLTGFSFCEIIINSPHAVRAALFPTILSSGMYCRRVRRDAAHSEFTTLPLPLLLPLTHDSKLATGPTGWSIIANVRRVYYFPVVGVYISARNVLRFDQKENCRNDAYCFVSSDMMISYIYIYMMSTRSFTKLLFYIVRIMSSYVRFLVVVLRV